MGLELSEAVNKKKKKREGKRETGGKRLRPDSPLQVVGEKGFLQVGSSVFSFPYQRVVWVLNSVWGWCLRLNAGVRGQCGVCVLR